VSDRSLAYPAHPEPEEDSGNRDFEHIGDIAVRAMLPATTRLRPCEVCGRRFQANILHPVYEDNPTVFEGQLLCGECARKHGAM
jgi:hypothetical protein